MGRAAEVPGVPFALVPEKRKQVSLPPGETPKPHRLATLGGRFPGT